MNEEALLAVNQMKRQMAMLARTIVNALADKKVSVWEGMGIAMQGTQFASSLVGLLQAENVELQKQILYVLEHGEFTLPEGV